MNPKDQSDNQRIRIGQESIRVNSDIANVVRDILENRLPRTKRSIDKFSVPSKYPSETKKNLKKVSRSAIPAGLKNSSAHFSDNQSPEPNAGVDGFDAVRLGKSNKSSDIPKESPKAAQSANSLIGGMNPGLATAAANLLGKPKSNVGSDAQDAASEIADSVNNALTGPGSKDAILKALNDGNIGNAVKNTAANANLNEKMKNLNEMANDFNDGLVTKRVPRPGPVPNLIPIVSKEEAEERAKKAQQAADSINKAAIANAAAGRKAAQDQIDKQNQLNNVLAMATSADVQKRQQMQSSQGGETNAKDGRVFDRAFGNDKSKSPENIKGEAPPIEEESEEARTTIRAKVALTAGASVLAIVAAISSVGVGGGGGAISSNAALMANQVNQTRCEVQSSNPEVDSDAGSPDMQNAKLQEMIPHFKGEIKNNAFAIIEATWEYDKVPQDKKARAAVIALATASQESTLRNIQYGDQAGPDSRGLFQQRNSWGSLEERMNPKSSTKLFLERLVKVPSWDTIPLTQAAQKVQISAHPDLYAKWEEWAKWILQQYRAGSGGDTTVTAAGLTDPGSTTSVFNLGFNWVATPASSSTDKFGDDVWQPPANDTIWNQTQISNDIRASYLRTRTNWPEIKSYGAWANRAKGGDHPKGNALDIMIPDYKSTQGISTGNEIADFFVANAQKYGITYVIWRNKMWLPSTGKWQTYNGANMYSGSELNDTTLHMDHVHISVAGNAGNYELPDNLSNSNTVDNGNTPDQVACGDDPLIEDTYNPDGIPQGLVKDNWASPMPNGKLTSDYGPRNCPAGVTCNQWVRFHYGLDISDGVGRGTGVGSPVYAPTKMKITHIRYKDQIGYGTSLLARSIEDPKYVFDFHHFAEGTIMVKTGDIVEAGTPIARAGTTGNSSGVHLHFQMMKPTSIDTKMVHKDTINPFPILKELGLEPK